MTDGQVHRSLRAEAARLWHRLPMGLELGDLVSEGWLGYQAAYPRATSFPHTFAMRRARGAMLDAIRRWRGVHGRKRDQSIPLESFDIRVHDAAAPVTPEAPEADRVLQALAQIQPRQREVIERLVLRGEHRQTVAAALGMKPQSVSMARSKGLARLRALVAA